MARRVERVRRRERQGDEIVEVVEEVEVEEREVEHEREIERENESEWESSEDRRDPDVPRIFAASVPIRALQVASVAVAASGAAAWIDAAWALQPNGLSTILRALSTPYREVVYPLVELLPLIRQVPKIYVDGSVGVLLVIVVIAGTATVARPRSWSSWLGRGALFLLTWFVSTALGSFLFGMPFLQDLIQQFWALVQG